MPQAELYKKKQDKLHYPSMQYPTFLANQEQLYEIFYGLNVLDKGASQQLFQLSKILAPDLTRTVFSFSGAKNSAQKAQTGCCLYLTCQS